MFLTFFYINGFTIEYLSIEGKFLMIKVYYIYELK